MTEPRWADESPGRWALPSSWLWTRARDVADIIGGGTPKNSGDPLNYDPEGIPWLTPADLTGYTAPYIERGKRSLSELGFANSAARITPPGSVLLSSRAPVGYCVLSKGEICTNQGFKSFVLLAGIVPEFVRYYLIGSKDYLQSKASGTTFLELSGSAVGQLQVPIAPSNEQWRIVEKIDELFSQIEAGEQALERAQKLLERYRQSVLTAAVTGELTREWREQHKGVLESGEVLLRRILQARREAWEQAELARMRIRGKPPTDDRWKHKYKEPEPPDLTDAPKVPTGWHLVSCDALAIHLTSGSRAWKPFYDKGNSTFIMAQNVRPGRYDRRFRQLVDPPSSDPEAERTRAQRGDLLVTIVGANTGDFCQFDDDAQDHYVCQSVALIRPWSDTYGQYLNFYFQAEHGGRRQYERYIYGAGRPHLSFAYAGANDVEMRQKDQGHSGHTRRSVAPAAAAERVRGYARWFPSLADPI
jgi:type I restriction enzyme, S subunit